MNWIQSLWRRFRSLFGPHMADLLAGGIHAAAPYLPEIYQIVKRVAQLTPTRSDDELVRVADELGVPAWLNAPTSGDALAGMVLAWARRKWPDAPTSRLRRAIEIAYGALKP